MYGEADFAERIRRKGYKVMCCFRVVAYHDIPLPEQNVENEMRKLGCDNPLRIYHFSKNRNIYAQICKVVWETGILYDIPICFSGILLYKGIKERAVGYCKGIYMEKNDELKECIWIYERSAK